MSSSTLKELDKVERLLKVVGPSSSSLNIMKPSLEKQQRSPVKIPEIRIVSTDTKTNREEPTVNTSATEKKLSPTRATVLSPASPFKSPSMSLQQLKKKVSAMAPITKEQAERQKSFSLFEESEEDIIDCTQIFKKKSS